MNNKIKFIIGVLIFAVVMAGAYFAYQNFADDYSPDTLMTKAETLTAVDNNTEERQTEASALEKAPDFSVIDENGNSVMLSDFVGKPVVLNFWASWCPPCKNEMPHFDEIYKQIGNDVQFMMVNLTNGYNGEDLETASAYMDTQNYEFPVFYDTENDAGSKYYTYSIPVTYFIDKDGMLVAQARGAINSETLLQGINMINN